MKKFKLTPSQISVLDKRMKASEDGQHFHLDGNRNSRYALLNKGIIEVVSSSSHRETVVVSNPFWKGSWQGKSVNHHDVIYKFTKEYLTSLAES